VFKIVIFLAALFLVSCSAGELFFGDRPSDRDISDICLETLREPGNAYGEESHTNMERCLEDSWKAAGAIPVVAVMGIVLGVAIISLFFLPRICRFVVAKVIRKDL
jgi:hypothetical protein